MNILNKWFKKEVKELADEAKKAEDLLDKVSDKVSLLRQSRKSTILKSAIEELINRKVTLITRLPQVWSIYNEHELIKINKEIDELLDEIDN